MFFKFAGDNAPEKYMLERLKESEDFARYVDDSDEFVSFIDCEISLSDHHGLFRVVGKFVGLSEEIVMFRVVEGVGLFFGGEFEGIREFINRKIL